MMTGLLVLLFITIEILIIFIIGRSGSWCEIWYGRPSSLYLVIDLRNNYCCRLYQVIIGPNRLRDFLLLC